MYKTTCTPALAGLSLEFEVPSSLSVGLVQSRLRLR
jgi:hypothetical protein